MARTMNQNISSLQDFKEIAGLPVAAALAALAVTWAVWYFTGNQCTEKLAAATGCNASAAAAFINPALLKDIATNSAIAATGGGVWSYIMITRERRAREAAEQALAQERQRAEAERQRAEAERQQAEAERTQLLAERQQAEAERQRADAERQRADAERQRADAERTRLLAEIDRLTRQLNNRQANPPDQET